MLNSEQQMVVSSNDSRILCLAGAGTGKTYTLIERIKHLLNNGVDAKSILVLTFTNAAAYEMSDRFTNSGLPTPLFCTFHAFCYSLLINDKEVLYKLGYSSTPEIITDDELKKVEQTVIVCNNIKLGKRKLQGNVSLLPKERFEYELYHKAMKQTMLKKNVITFDRLCNDVCNLFIHDDNSIVKYKNQYKYILVDEFQDTDPVQFAFIESFSESDLFVVGDALQCQPAGTLVTLSDMTAKPIESIQIGDHVLSYSCAEGHYLKDLNYKSGDVHRYTKQVTAISKHYANNVVKVVAKNHTSCYTKDHITYAKIHYNGNEQNYVTYLMSNDLGWWRVGSTKLFLQTQSTGFGPRLRLKAEHGNRVWILGVHKSVNDAWINEQLVAYKFGIPQMTWEHKNVKFNKSDMQYVYDNLEQLQENAKRCLDYFNRDINYPLFTSDDLHTHFSKLHLFECRVGNLMPGIFDIVYPEFKIDAKGCYRLHNNYEEILDIIDEPPQVVYGLDIEDTHNYVADGVLTHNCLYAFRGADSSIIKSLASNDNWTTYRLQKNYRSDIDICNYANEKSIYADGSYRVCIQPVSDQTGFVKEYIIDSFMGDDNNKCLDILNELSEGETVAVIARTNAEVDRIKKFLDQHGIKYDNPVQSDILPMLRHMNDEQSMIDWLASKLLSNDYILYLKDRYVNKDTYTLAQFYQRFGGKQAISDIMCKLMAIQEIVANSTDFATDSNAVLSILGFETYVLPDYVTDFNLLFDNLIQYIEHHNTADTRLHVGTIHSVKGLEYDTVIVYGVRSNYFRLDNEDNLNLFYVAITRARHKLFIFREHYYGL